MQFDEKKLEEVSKKYEEKLRKCENSILKNAFVFLLSKKCLETDKYTHYLVYIFPDEDYPLFLIQWDEKCLVCGENLTKTEDEVKCHICGKTIPKGLKIVCGKGHHICKDCYYQHLNTIFGEILLSFLFEIIFKNYDKIKKVAEEEAKENEKYTRLERELGKAVALRDTIYTVIKTHQEEYFKDVEITLFTMFIRPNLLFHLKKDCLKCEKMCETVRKLLEGD